jgi:ATP-dependent Clp protease protease subunit
MPLKHPWFYSVLLATLCSVFLSLNADSAESPKTKTPAPPEVNKAREPDKHVDELTQEIERLKLEKSKLTLENIVQSEKHETELIQLQQEKERLTLANELALEKTRQELAKLNAEKEKLNLQNEVTAAKQAQALFELSGTKDRLEMQNAVEEAKRVQSHAENEVERTKLLMQNALLEERNKQQELQYQLDVAKINVEVQKIEFDKLKKNQQAEELAQKIATYEKQREWETLAEKPIEYLKEPYSNGRLVITDRRISLNGFIFTGFADYVTERINFFNNKNSEYPIFLVIDYCAGGSVMEGSKIVKAMQNSRAPVYVVVKSFAASMAAVITTLAKRSFAYPDAIIVHHQVWGNFAGNVTQQQEQLQMTKEWAKRVMQPVAEKMGLSLQAMIEQMYQHNSDGNWREFADAAVKLKWVDHLVEDIKETSYLKYPAEKEESTVVIQQAKYEKQDAQGQRYIQLPRLNPLDVYHLYNPDNYYR